MKTVLIVDYDPRRIDKIRRCVRAFGAQAILATDSDAGEREYHRLRPDLTLIEDILPKRRGYQLCADLKANCGDQPPPVLLMAFFRNGGRHRVGLSRCDDYIEEPFDEVQLFAKVGRFLSPGAASSRGKDH